MPSKKGFVCLFFSSISASMEKHREEATWLVKRLYKQTLWTTNAIVDGVTPLVEAWEPACVETSQYIKSHETAPTLQISYCIVEHIYIYIKKNKKTKQKKKNLCAYERKATCTGASCLYLFTRRDTVTNHVYWPHSAGQRCTFKVGMDIRL